MYIVYGMTYEQFWFGDPNMVVAYREAHLLKRKMRNEELWINGLYNYNGFGAVVSTAFGKHREEYVKKPFDIFPKTETEKQLEIREERRKLIAWLNGKRKAIANRKKDTGSESDGKS